MLGNINLTPLFEAVIAVLGAIVARYLVPWIKSKTTAQQRETMLSAIHTAVYGAEKMGFDKAGKDKLDMVCDLMRMQGYDVDSNVILNAIEAEVEALNLKQAAVHANAVHENG